MKKILLGLLSFTFGVSAFAQLSGTVSSTDVTCNGSNDGAATITPINPGGNVVYNWSNGANTATAAGLAAGMYFITITDDSLATYIDSVVINQPTALASSVATTDVTCAGNNDGSATITASGGTVPYTYSWNSGGTATTETNLSTGTYTCAVTDANGCVTNTNATINQPTALTLAITNNNATCDSNGGDGSSTATVSGGTMPYSYGWSNGGNTATVSNLLAGAYNVDVVDANGCMISDSAFISNSSIITIVDSIVDVTTNGGNDGFIYITASGTYGPPFTYLWSTGATMANLDSAFAGTYTLNVTDSVGCSSTYTGVITQPTPAALSITVATTDETTSGSCDGTATVSVAGGTAPYTYAWSNDSLNVAASAMNLCAGTYTVEVSENGGTTQSYTFTIAAGAASLEASASATNETSASACDGSATGTATGGTGNYTFQWMNLGDSAIVGTASTVNGLCAGTYLFMVDDSVSTASFEVTVGTDSTQSCSLPVSLTASNETSAGAANGSLVSAITGGTFPFSYTWSNGATTQDLLNLSPGTFSLSVVDAAGCTGSATATIGTDSTVTPQPLVVSATKTKTSCAGLCDGTATLTATGGTAPYAFMWSNGSTTSSVNTFCAGTYSYTVTDAAGVTGLGYVNILNGTALSVAVDSIVGITNATCGQADGAAGVMPVGGTSPFTYAWSGGQITSSITGVNAGMKTVVVTDDSGCTSTFQLVIGNTAGPSVTVLSSTNANCGGVDGNVMITVTGGTAPYTYLWGNGVTAQNLLDAESGIRYVQVTDANGCVGSASAYIGESGTNAPTIFGNVTNQSGNIITAGYVAIYADAPYATAMDTIATAPIDNQGNYYFSSILPIGDYILQVKADTNVHPGAIPTYNGNTNAWGSATVVPVSCDQNLTIDLTAKVIAPMGGNSNFSGVIISNGTGGRRAGDPIPGIDVSLEQIPGGIVGFSNTDDNGKFKFNNVPTGAGQVYQVKVDIPGLAQSATYTIDPTSSDTTQSGLDFVVSEQGIDKAVTSSITKIASANNVKMYPNPSNGDIFFTLNIENSTEVSYEIYNIVGERIATRDLGTYHNGINTFQVTNLSAGVYTIAVRQGTTNSTFKALVVE